MEINKEFKKLRKSQQNNIWNILDVNSVLPALINNKKMATYERVQQNKTFDLHMLKVTCTKVQ